MHRFYTLLVTEHTRQTLFLGPTTVTIHDDSDMSRQTRLVYLFFIIHLSLNCYICGTVWVRGQIQKRYLR